MKKLLTVVALLVLSVGVAFAQVTTGTLVGIVRDKSGAAISNASVMATNEATGVVYPGKANKTGEFRIQYLPAGSYDIKSTAPGFSTETLTGLLVQPNIFATADLSLSAATANTVEVVADAGITIDTTTSTLGTSFLPVETRDFPVTTNGGSGVINLALLAPGVSSSGGIGAGTGGTVSGQRPRNNNFEVDGIDNNNKTVTGPNIYVPNDAVGQFTLLENVYGAQYGHSTGGQFNQLIATGSNQLHGDFYEFTQNRNLDAIDPIQGRANIANGANPKFQPRFDFNRYGGQLGGAVIKNKLFIFSNFERQTLGEGATSASYCAPTAAGFTTLGTLAFNSTNNPAVYKQYSPVALHQAPTAGDAGCPGSTISITDKNGVAHSVAVGDFSVTSPDYYNHYYSTNSGDYTISAADSVHLRYVYNRADGIDEGSSSPAFFITEPSRYHLVALNETHIFTANLSNDFRLGYTRFFNVDNVPPVSFPGLTQFPNLVFDELNYFNIGPSPNAPQGNVDNLYQAIDSVTYIKGRHTIVVGGEGRKHISPEIFVQRARGDYEYSDISIYLNDQSPDILSQRNALGAIGTPTFYGDQTAFYAYANDDFRISPKFTLNAGLRYEFTSVPASEKLQSLNSAASVPGLITFGKPTPQYKNFAPRIGFAYAPDQNTSIRAGFTMGYDVLYDNIGTTEAPPQFQSTENGNLAVQSPNFLATGGLPATFSFTTVAQQRAATTALVPNQKLPYSEAWTLGIEHVFLHDYTAEVRYVGTRGIHLDVQDRINVQTPVTAATQLPTAFGGSTSVIAGPSTKASLSALPYDIPAYSVAGFTGNIVADEPYGQSAYNGLQTQLTRRFTHGLLFKAAYTWSKTMDNATADFNTSATNPRRPQDFQNIASEYSLSALSRKHRVTIAAVYDVPYFKNSNWLLKNLVGNWEVTPIYTFQSPEFTTVQSGVDSNLNGDSATDRAFVNTNGVKGTGSTVVPIYNPALSCNGATAGTYSVANGTQNVAKACSAQIIGYAEGSLSTAHVFTGSNAYYVQGGAGTLPNGGRNTLPTGRTNNVDMALYKRFNFYKNYKVEIGAQGFNMLNHPQFEEGSTDDVGSIGSTGYRGFDTVSTPNTFNQKQLIFPASVRYFQLSGKITF